MKIINLFILFFLFAITSSFYAASDNLMDTIAIDSIHIVESRGIFYSNLINTTKIDTITKENNATSTLSELLFYASNVYVHGYGISGFSTSANIRGAGSYQTVVNWNGFPINSSTLGTYDLSAVNASMVEDIYIIKGASSTLYGSGSFGGAIDLLNIPDWDNKLNIAYAGSSGSFNDYSNSLILKLGNNKVQLTSNFQTRNANLNFPFTDKGQDIEYIFKNNCLKSNHFNQQFYFKNHKYNIEAGLWYAEKLKEIPRSSHSTEYDIQKDSILRSYIKVKRNFATSIIQINSAYLSNYQRFASLPSIQANQLLLDIDYRIFINKHYTIELGNFNHLTKAKSQYYDGLINEYKYGFIIGTKISYPKIITNLFFRKELHDYYTIKPVASVNIKYQIVKNKFFVSGDISRNYRIPTLNDRFWVNSSNPDLVPEHVWNYSLGLQYCGKYRQSEIELKTNIFLSLIENLIQWFPTENISIWRPENAKIVWSRGVDAGLIYKYKIYKIKFKLQADYIYSKSTNKEVYVNSETLLNKQLRYCPQHNTKVNLTAQFKKYFLFIGQSYTSSRYIDEENSEFRKLSGFYIANISLGNTHIINSFSGRISFSISNIFNTWYRLVNEYPMPGRTFNINYKIQYNK